MTRTRSPGANASWCTSIVASPYSSAYDSSYVAAGSFPFFRTGTNPAPSASATGAARMNPRASIPTTLSTIGLPSSSVPAAASASTTWPKPV